MNRKLILALIALAVAGAGIGAWFAFVKSDRRASVTVTLRLAVTPPEKAGFVAAQAGSARFKYEIGKKAGLRPALAQKLTAVVKPNTGMVELQVAAETTDDGRRYVAAFVEILQAQCGGAAQLTVVQSSVR